MIYFSDFDVGGVSTSYSNLGGTGYRIGAGLKLTTTGAGMQQGGSSQELIDGTPSSSTYYWTGGASGGIVAFEFEVARVIDEFKWYQDISQSQGTWTFDGSNDGSSWTTLTSVTLNDGTFPFSNMTAYKYYRLSKSNVNTRSDNAYLEQIEFKIDEFIGPSYLNPQGTGDRTASITISNTGLSITGTISQLINGAYANSTYFNGGAGNGTQWLLFDFGSDKRITGFTWYQDLAASHGTWQFEGSPDNSSWTNITSLTLSATEFTFTNATSYRYYRLRHMSGSTSSAPYIREIEFKIDT